MEILPPELNPPDAPLSHRHTPPQRSNHGDYRDCLRWDFGFHCAFCLLHETDLFPEGVMGSGLMSAEHIVPQSVDPRLKAVYRNLIYACRFCNRSRSNQPIWLRGRRLLDPSATPWAEHFGLQGGELVPKSRDRHARRTEEVYKLNRKLKVGLRQIRKRRLKYFLKAIQTIPEDLQFLRARWLKADDPEEAAGLQKAINSLNTQLEVCREEARKLRAVPRDRPDRCACASPLHCTLPDPIRRQVIVVEL